MSGNRKQCYVVADAAELPVHLRDRTPFVLRDAEMVLRFPRGEVFGSEGQVKMNGAIEFQTQISPAVLSEICDPDEIYKGEMRAAHRFRCVYDPELQRGIKETAKGPREHLRDPQVASMMKDIEAGRFECPQLMWNLRAGDTVWAYLKDARELRIYEGVATRPDSNHRHHAIIRFHRQYQQWVAQTGSERMGAYNPAREYGLVVYTDDYKGEAHRSYVYNALGWKVPSSTAEYLESKTQAPNVHSKLARELMEQASVLGHQNVEILGNSVPRNSAKMVSFSTLVQAVRAACPRLLENEYDGLLRHLVRFVEALGKARPKEIAVLEASQRQRVRESSLADHPVLWSAYLRLAAQTFGGCFPDWEPKLQLLAEGKSRNGADFFSLDNPQWAERGVVARGKGGNQVRNNPKSREEAFNLLCDILGIGWGAAPPEEAKSSFGNGGDTAFHERLMKGGAAPRAAAGEKPAPQPAAPARRPIQPAAPEAPPVSPAARDIKEAFADRTDLFQAPRPPAPPSGPRPVAAPLRPVPAAGGENRRP